MAASLGPPRRGTAAQLIQCVRHCRIQKDPEGSKIDAVSILAFASMNDVEDYLVSDDHAAIQASEDALADEGSEWWTAVNFSVINRLAPEVATDRSL